MKRKNNESETRHVVLGEIASRIGRGTSLAGKSLDFAGDGDRKAGICFPDPSVYGVVYKNDYLYIDSASFVVDRVAPKKLASIPAGQERYTIDERDGRVLLVARNGQFKRWAFYHAQRPTLIANSVFIVRFADDVDIELLRRWLCSPYASKWLRGGGQMLSKEVLASLPIPTLEPEARKKLLETDRAYEKKINDVAADLDQLKSDRVCYLASAFEEFSQECERGR